jgi:hypothetical protein
VAAANDGMLFGGGRNRCFARLADVLQTALERIIPFGFQDEAGFHYGAMPDSARLN